MNADADRSPATLTRIELRRVAMPLVAPVAELASVRADDQLGVAVGHLAPRHLSLERPAHEAAAVEHRMHGAPGGIRTSPASLRISSSPIFRAPQGGFSRLGSTISRSSCAGS